MDNFLIKPKVSVIVPVYNSSKYLEEMLKGVVNQTLKDIEIICINDASTDNSLEILEKYAESDKRIKIISNKENLGPGYSRNIALNSSKGEYISFIDSDDTVESDMLEIAYNECKQFDLDMAILRINSFDTISGNSLRDYYILSVIPKDVFCYDDVKGYIFSLCHGWACNKVFKRSFIQENNISFAPYNIGEDMTVTYVSLAIAKRIKYVITKKSLYHYRKNIGTNLSEISEERLTNLYLVLKYLRDELIERRIYNKTEYDFANLCISFLIYNLSVLNNSKRKFYNLLKNEFFNKLNIQNYPQKCFCSQYNYYRYKLIMENDYSEELCAKHFEGFNIQDLFLSNSEKIVKLFEHFEEIKIKVAIWEEPQRGFERELINFCKCRNISTFAQDEADIVIVSNSSWYEEAVNRFDKVFDLDAYLKFSLDA